MNLHAPRTHPRDYGFKPGDAHCVVNAHERSMTAWSFEGVELWHRNCLAMGQDPKWWVTGGDCPPGVWKIGEIYNDYNRVGDNPSWDRTLRSYGWLSFDMVDLEGREDGNNRAGLMIHGGGAGCGWPGAWAPRQRLVPTLGCLRMHNEDLRDYLFPLTKEYETVYISVYQDDI